MINPGASCTEEEDNMDLTFRLTLTWEKLSGFGARNLCYSSSTGYTKLGRQSCLAREQHTTASSRKTAYGLAGNSDPSLSSS